MTLQRESKMGNNKEHQNTIDNNDYVLEVNNLKKYFPIKSSFLRIVVGNVKAVDGILQTYCPEMDDNARQAFLYAFFPFIYGLYPYTNVTEKQKSAMIEAGIDYAYYSVHDLAYNCLIKLLK